MSMQVNEPVEIILAEILCEYFKVAVVHKIAVAFPYAFVVPVEDPSQAGCYIKFK